MVITATCTYSEDRFGPVKCKDELQDLPRITTQGQLFGWLRMWFVLSDLELLI